MATAQEVIAAIDGYMQKFSGKTNGDWYVGIASDARKRLFTDHNVDEKNGAWIYRQADSHTIARNVEAAYHKAGCKGGPGGGDDATDKVYAYVITSTTAE